MRERIVKAQQHSEPVLLMYIDKHGVISKRRVRILHVSKQSFQAYCFVRRAKRTFLIDSVLAVVPIVKKEKFVV